jgi:histidine ammonia-lyase
VLACELLGALAATDFRRPVASGRGTGAAYATARTVIAPLETDRSPAPDIAAARALLRDGTLIDSAHAAIGAHGTVPANGAMR